MLEGTFSLNKATFAPLQFAGLDSGPFLAFSGTGPYRNHPGCTSIYQSGALPAGDYWIADRPRGGVKTRLSIAAQDLWTGNRHNEWFALYRDDGQTDDWTLINSIKRGNFRLHPVGIYGVSEGCITLQHSADFYIIRNALLRNGGAIIPGSIFKAYGKIKVIGYEKKCPYPA